MRSRKTAARSSRPEWQQDALPGFELGYYTALIHKEERAGLAAPASLDDEQRLLRSRAYRLAARIKFDQYSEEDVRLGNLLVRMIDAITTIERTKLLGRSKGVEAGESILDALRALDPYEEL